MNIKKLVATILSLGALGTGVIVGSPASALTCRIPDLTANVIPRATAIRASCVHSTFTATGLASSTTSVVSANLVAGDQATAGGYNSAKSFISGCVVTDLTTTGGPVSTPACSQTVAFHDLILRDN